MAEPAGEQRHEQLRDAQAGVPGVEASGAEAAQRDAENAGAMFALTVTENDAVVAHCPAPGVNVLVPEF